MEYSGHILGAQGNCPAEKNVLMKNFPDPKNASDIRSFFGLSGYYRKYVYRYGEIAEPLKRWTKDNNVFIWGQEKQNAFDQLKNALGTAPVLSSPLLLAVQCISCDVSIKEFPL